jgi:hypothetical protein
MIGIGAGQGRKFSKLSGRRNPARANKNLIFSLGA